MVENVGVDDFEANLLAVAFSFSVGSAMKTQPAGSAADQMMSARHHALGVASSNACHQQVLFAAAQSLDLGQDGNAHQLGNKST